MSASTSHKLVVYFRSTDSYCLRAVPSRLDLGETSVARLIVLLGFCLSEEEQRDAGHAFLLTEKDNEPSSFDVIARRRGPARWIHVRLVGEPGTLPALDEIIGTLLRNGATADDLVVGGFCSRRRGWVVRDAVACALKWLTRPFSRRQREGLATKAHGRIVAS